MTKIQIIIDDEKSLKAFTCTNLEMFSTPAYEGIRYLHSNPTHYTFTANNIVLDESPNLISLPDELLLRIRDYNIDAEYQYEIETAQKLKQKNDSLQQSIGYHLEELNELKKEIERYHEVLRGMIDRYPMAAAEIALEDDDIPLAYYYAQKANEEEEKDA